MRDKKYLSTLTDESAFKRLQEFEPSSLENSVLGLLGTELKYKVETYKDDTTGESIFELSEGEQATIIFMILRKIQLNLVSQIPDYDFFLYHRREDIKEIIKEYGIKISALLEDNDSLDDVIRKVIEEVVYVSADYLLDYFVTSTLR